MQNKFAGYKSSIIKVLLNDYKIPDYQISREKVDRILLFFHDFEDIWKLLISGKVYKYKQLNDREISSLSFENRAKKYILRHICEVCKAEEDRESEFQTILDTIAGIYKDKKDLPLMKEYMYKYINSFNAEIRSHMRKYPIDTANIDIVKPVRIGIKSLKKHIDTKVREAEKEDKLWIYQRDNILEMGDFFYDIYMSYYSNKYTKYMDKHFTLFPIMSKSEWFMKRFRDFITL